MGELLITRPKDGNGIFFLMSTVRDHRGKSTPVIYEEWTNAAKKNGWKKTREVNTGAQLIEHWEFPGLKRG